MPLGRRRNRRARCSRTMRPSTSCSVAYIWPRAMRRRARNSSAARCGWTLSCPQRIGCSVSRSSRWAALPKRWRAGISGIASRPAAPTKKRSVPPSSARARRPGCSPLADDIRALSAQLAQDPQSLVFLRLAEALRRKGQLDSALRVAVNGLERHPHLADAHDLCARVLTDKHDYERAFDEWDMAVRIAPHHTGALKGLAFLYFKVGHIAQAEVHLEAARKIEPDDPSIDQAFEMIRGGAQAPSPESAAAALPSASAPAPAGAAPSLDEARVFAGLEGAHEGLLLIDGAGRVLGGALKDRSGADV